MTVKRTPLMKVEKPAAAAKGKKRPGKAVPARTSETARTSVDSRKGTRKKGGDPELLIPRETAGPMSAVELRGKLGVTQLVMARLLNISVRQISALENGTDRLSPQTVRHVREIQVFYEGLATVADTNPEFLSRWLMTPNESLLGLTPVEVIERGEIGRLYRMIYLLGSGMPT